MSFKGGLWGFTEPLTLTCNECVLLDFINSGVMAGKLSLENGSEYSDMILYSAAIIRSSRDPRPPILFLVMIPPLPLDEFFERGPF